MLFRLIYDDALAQAAYVVGCQASGEAIIFDPGRDIERYIELASQHRMRIVGVAETHIHADFLSGARELAERTGATVYLSDEGGPDWSYRWLHDREGGGTYPHQLLRDGDRFQIGQIGIRAMHTPGHTPEHVCFELTDMGSGIAEPMGLISGDFVFVGDLGRPDLLETAAGIEGAREEGAKALSASARNFLKLPDHLQIWPGHGSGSACGKALGAVPQSTVGYERRFNPALQHADDEDAFVQFILEDQPDPPFYFSRMKTLNRDGVPLLGGWPEPKSLTAEELVSIDSHKIAVVDLRGWEAFRVGHLAGSIKPLGGVGFLASLGSFVKPEEDIVLIVDRDQLNDTIRKCISIGLDRIIGWASPSTLAVALESIQGGATMDQVPPGDVPAMVDAGAALLDVRNAGECAAGMIEGAMNIPYTRLLARMDEIPEGAPLIVNCKGGGRSAAACSMLARAGRSVANLEGGYQGWMVAQARNRSSAGHGH